MSKGFLNRKFTGNVQHVVMDTKSFDRFQSLLWPPHEVFDQGVVEGDAKIAYECVGIASGDHPEYGRRLGVMYIRDGASGKMYYQEADPDQLMLAQLETP